ncbi:MAG: hypothetical protein LBQ63_03925 [Deltaproteobacteria bacterium]|jgi:tetratricopeptide (TPR) repeat protein|nr:hypothetical protein [Deltaproteobacteria bacterium]
MFRRVLTALLSLILAWPVMEAAGAALVLGDAHKAYNAEKYAATGVYAEGSVLFVVQNLPLDGKSRDALTSRAMLQSSEMLWEYLEKYHRDPKHRIQPCSLKTLFPDSLALARESMREARPQLKAASRVLENKFSNSVYRYVIAVSLTDLLGNISENVLYAEPSQEEMATGLRRTWQKRERSGRLPEMARAFGLLEDLFRPDYALMAADWPGAPWLKFSSGLNVRAVASAWEQAGKTLTSSKAGREEELREVLGGAPPLPSMLAWLADRAASDGKTGKAVLWILWQGSDKKRLAVFLDKLGEAEGKAEFKDAANEYKILAEQFSDLQPPTGLFAKDAASPLASAWLCLGHADFSQAKKTLPPEYAEALQLFEKGAELEKIIRLSAKAADTAPANPAGWALLGKALYAKKQFAVSLPFLTQAFWLDPRDAETRIYLAWAYKNLNLRKLASGMAASVYFACPEPSSWASGKADEILAGN